MKWGRLRYVGKHYLKFAERAVLDSRRHRRAGGFPGLRRTSITLRPSTNYAAHVEDWRDGDPEWGDGRGHGLIGRTQLSGQRARQQHLFSDDEHRRRRQGRLALDRTDRSQGEPANDNLHYDVAKLAQWEIVFDHAQRLGIFLHFVFNEAEEANKRELDDGELGPERKLYYREMIARFGHHLALQWNLCEEYNLNFDFGPERIRAFADYMRAIDPYDHPITVHSAGDPVEKLRFTYRRSAVQHDVDPVEPAADPRGDRGDSPRDPTGRPAAAGEPGRIHARPRAAALRTSPSTMPRAIAARRSGRPISPAA